MVDFQQNQFYFNENQKIIEDRFIVQDFLGKGTYGQVFKCCKVSDPKQLFAIKVYPTKAYEMRPEKYYQIKREVDILKKLKHQNICQLVEFQIDLNYYYLVQEYCNKNNLAMKIKNEGIDCNGRFKRLLETNVILLMQQLIDAFRYMHTLQKDNTIIVHRDIKLENIFVHEVDGIENLKLGDFGFARETQKENLLDTFLGSPFTQAPEISILQKYDERADIYSMGVVFYQMLFGDYPYVTKAKQNKAQILAGIIEKEPINLKQNGVDITKLTQVLLTKMITYNPKNRITFQRLFDHPYFTPRRKEFEKQQELQIDSFSHKTENAQTRSFKIEKEKEVQKEQMEDLKLNIQFIAKNINFSLNFIESFRYQLDDDFEKFTNWRKSSINFSHAQQIEEEKKGQEEEKKIEYYQQKAKKLYQAQYVQGQVVYKLCLSAICEKTISTQFDGVWREKQIFILLIDFDQDREECLELLKKWLDLIDIKTKICKRFILVIKDSLFDKIDQNDKQIHDKFNSFAEEKQIPVSFIEQKTIEIQVKQFIDKMFTQNEIQEIFDYFSSQQNQSIKLIKQNHNKSQKNRQSSANGSDLSIGSIGDDCC